MMRLWFKAETVFTQNPKRFASQKSGLRLRFDKNVNPEVKRCIKEFCKWIRKTFIFPIRLVIYIKNTKYVRSNTGELVSAKFWSPYVLDKTPYAVIAVGDFQDKLEGRQKDNKLASILCSIGHELTHYYQWIIDPQLAEEKSISDIKKEERQAKYYAGEIVDYYANTREHP